MCTVLEIFYIFPVSYLNKLCGGRSAIKPKIDEFGNFAHLSKIN